MKMGIGHWALGIGHWAWGIGHGALGVGRWAFEKISQPNRKIFLPLIPTKGPELPIFKLVPMKKFHYQACKVVFYSTPYSLLLTYKSVHHEKISQPNMKI